MKILLYCLLLVSLSVSSMADEWGSWDDLPDNLFENTKVNAEGLKSLELLLSSQNGDISVELEAWLLELDIRLQLSDEEFADLLDELEGEDPDDIMEELQEWLDDQADDLEDELEDLQKELDRAAKEDNSGSGSSGSGS